MKLFSRSQEIEQAPKRRKAPQTVDEWRAEAARAEQKDDWSRAVVCYRRALQLAPFSGELRQEFELALVEQIAMASPDLAVDPEAVILENAEPRGLDDEFEDVEEDWEVESAPRSKSKAARRPARSYEPPMILSAAGIVKMAAVGLAIVVTGGGILLTVAATSWVGGLFKDESLPTVEVASLPEELTNKIQEANRLLAEGNSSKAADLLRDAAQDFPSHQESINISLAQTLRVEANKEFSNRRYSQAAKLFAEATDADPDNAMNWIDLGRAYREEAHALSGNTSRQREKLEKAEKSYSKALDVSPDNSIAMSGLAQVYIEKNDRKNAIDYFEKVVALAPSSSEGKLASQKLRELNKR